MLLSVTMKVTERDLARLIVKEYSLAPEMPSFAFSTSQDESEDCQVRGVYGGQFDTDAAGSNLIGVKNVSNSFPFDIDFGLDFRNFIQSSGDTVKFAQRLAKSGSPYSDEKELS